MSIHDELQPRNEGEEREAARAVYARRKLDEQIQLVENLTAMERLLVEEAWAAGANALRKDLARELIHPHAVTLDAASVKRKVEEWSRSPDALRPKGWVTADTPYDERIVGIVRRASRRLEDSQ